MSYEYLAQKMVQESLVEQGIEDPGIIQAFLRVPRHLFVDEALQDRAYEGHPLPIGSGQTISQPYIQAFSLSLLKLKREMRVLEVGTGSGYQTALLAEIVDDVCSIEQYPELTAIARQRLEGLGYHTVRIRTGDGSQGWPQWAPYDAIVVAATGTQIPPPLYDQLKPSGRMVLPVRREGQERLILVVKGDKGPIVLDKGACRFVPLRGKFGV